MRPAAPSPLDEFIPAFDARERYAVTVRAPAHRVYEAAKAFDMQSIFLVRMIFTLRAKVMRATPVVRKARGFMEEMRSLGWGCLAERPGELFVAGATCQPWLADVTFTPVAPERFSDVRGAGAGQDRVDHRVPPGRPGADVARDRDTGRRDGPGVAREVPQVLAVGQDGYHPNPLAPAPRNPQTRRSRRAETPHMTRQAR